MKTGQIAKHLSVSPSTVRFWASEYATYLSDGATGLNMNKGATRVFNEQDALVLATIAQMRDKGETHEQIVSALDQGRLVNNVPSAPKQDEMQPRQTVGLVTVDELHRALDQIQFLQLEIERLTEERDLALIHRDRDVAELNQKIAQLHAELGRAEGKLAIIERERKPFEYWLRVMVVVILIAVVVTAMVVFLLLTSNSVT